MHNYKLMCMLSHERSNDVGLNKIVCYLMEMCAYGNNYSPFLTFGSYLILLAVVSIYHEKLFFPQACLRRDRGFFLTPRPGL